MYETIGGEKGVRALVDRFYDLMHSLPEAKDIRVMHPDSLDDSREKLLLFLTGWMGGPQLYVQKFGHPRLRARHMPFAIATKERDQWMLCMKKALEDPSIPALLKMQLEGAFSQLADHMRNVEE